MQQRRGMQTTRAFRRSEPVQPRRAAGTELGPRARYLLAEEALRASPGCRRRRAELRQAEEQLAAAMLAADKSGFLRGTVSS